MQCIDIPETRLGGHNVRPEEDLRCSPCTGRVAGSAQMRGIIDVVAWCCNASNMRSGALNVNMSRRLSWRITSKPKFRFAYSQAQCDMLVHQEPFQDVFRRLIFTYNVEKDVTRR